MSLKRKVIDAKRNNSPIRVRTMITAILKGDLLI